jgi:hypothetical protein
MRSVPAGSAPPGLADPWTATPALVTCAGHFDKVRYSYHHGSWSKRYAGLA